MLDLLKEGQVWRWAFVEQSAFNSIKAMLASLPVFYIPVLHEAFVIFTNASDIYIGTVVELCG